MATFQKEKEEYQEKIKKLNDENEASKQKVERINSIYSKYFNNIEEFNKLDGEQQISIIKEIKEFKNDDKIDKIFNLLKYLSDQIKQEKSQSNKFNYIFIYDDNKNEIPANKDIINKISTIVGINYNVTEFLFKSNKFMSGEFSYVFKLFSEFYIQIKYPDNNFDNIYKNVLNLKLSNKSKIKIEIFITGMNETDAKFQQNKNIDSIKIDSMISVIKGSIKNVKCVGSFYNCESLTRVSIPPSVICIDNCAFQNCKSLTCISIPPSVTKICNQAFEDCKSLKQISIPSSVTFIGNYAFENCSSLTQIAIPSSVDSIGNHVFKGCSSLVNLTIPSVLIKSDLDISSKVRIEKI